ncbi:hypothetical protein CLU86_0254 [Acidovorax sp. 62]|nr:hypothetical protein CLU86_0254 [Acidovorax sp. 62]
MTPGPPRRPRGRPKQTSLERLRPAWALLSMQRASGLSWGALERTYIAAVAPERLERGVRKPDAFLRYRKADQAPRGVTALHSPVRWALKHHPAFARTYESPLFELLTLGHDPDTLIQFSRDIHTLNRVTNELLSLTMPMKALISLHRFHGPLWKAPKSVVALRHVAEPDALCLILIALKANSGGANEQPCLAIAGEWLRNWIIKVEPHENLIECMLQTLAECVPETKALVQGDAWKTLALDLSSPCFLTSREELLIEGLRSLWLRTPCSTRNSFSA